MDKIKLIIDNKEVSVPKGSTILEAAHKIGIDIPTLCHFELKDLDIHNKPGGCRICVVEVEGRRNLAPACVTECTEGMIVKTNSIRVLNARRTVLELLLSDHPADCLVCAKSCHCQLQDLAARFGVREIPFQGEQSSYQLEVSPSIIRDMNKCVMCRRCETMCNELQTVGALNAIERGFPAVVSTAFNQTLANSPCTFCGQCVAVCPVGALVEMDHTPKVIRAIADGKKTVVVQVAPAVRVALGEEFGMKPGTIVTGKLTAALKALGFNYVFDTDWSADLTIMEEGTELIDKLTRHLNGDKSVKLPLLSSCCPAWVNFFEYHFPELKDIPSTAKSPQQMFGSIAKSYFADKIGVKREDMVVVSVMPCLAKKYECARDEFKVDGNPDVDYSISTRELAALIKQANIDFKSLEDAPFDSPLGESTGAAVIFGTTGGVIEAAVRTVYEVLTKKPLPKLEFTELRGLEGVRSATIDVDGFKLNIGIAHGLSNARKLLNEIKEGKSQFHAIEVMACPGGCIDGGGQPLHHGNSEIIKARWEAIYEADRNMPIRKSHENPSIQAIYKEFLGEPCGHKSHELLHTHYFDKAKVIEVKLD
ncbi:MAG: NADH-dependent [FeFe] hydrogenase, group A6 [Bacteroidetes bacterium]|nr:NADH-dependent [FeFe] hydrogenase, group A6 [Bacteroidota bacterium]MCL2302998.1 NADH-dependent [FeFe] hydrogenase, group A6 [Lentimicrobiaceae bacterium]